MKKIVFILFYVFISVAIYAQSGDNYLTDAYRLLSEGNIESAENHYIAYQRLTNQTDVTFEALLKEKKEANNKPAWQKECYIVDCGEYMLAVQKNPVYYKYNYDNAVKSVRASRLGGFDDWDLPTKEEMIVIFNAVGSNFEVGDYWTASYGYWTDDKNSEYSLKLLGLWEKGTSSVWYRYVFTNYHTLEDELHARAEWRYYKNLLKDKKDYNYSYWFVIVRRFKK